MSRVYVCAESVKLLLYLREPCNLLSLPPSSLSRLKSCLIRQTVAHMSVSRVTLNVRQTKGLSYLKSSWIKAFFPPINFDSPPKWKVWSDREEERGRLRHRLQADGHVRVQCCLALLPRDYTWKKTTMRTQTRAETFSLFVVDRLQSKLKAEVKKFPATSLIKWRYRTKGRVTLAVMMPAGPQVPKGMNGWICELRRY